MPKDEDISSKPKYPVEAQNAIFNFVFVLANEYQSAGMNYQDAIVKACDWNISLSEHIKAKALEFQKDLADKQKTFINNDQQKGET